MGFIKPTDREVYYFVDSPSLGELFFHRIKSTLTTDIHDINNPVVLVSGRFNSKVKTKQKIIRLSKFIKWYKKKYLVHITSNELIEIENKLSSITSSEGKINYAVSLMKIFNLYGRSLKIRDQLLKASKSSHLYAVQLFIIFIET